MLFIRLGCDALPEGSANFGLQGRRSNDLASRSLVPNALVDLEECVPGIVVEMRYAAARNFLGRALYRLPRASLRAPVARKLANGPKAAAMAGLGLKVWDAFRPAVVQRLMWAACPDPRFVAPPERGSRHTRGAAVDVTLVRLNDGAELPMGTGFDDFTPRAASDFEALPAEVLANRHQLRDLMLAAGFTGIRSEWWHFDDAEWEKYPMIEGA
ncbi:MAG TPA: D-alanyl-D-alanine dipeptidase [Verrucomicrobiota bacterium]|nr:D-alanyl-D-alanine dipeptidase [Verrucomicrobiales bacterium]HRI13693.1 D-alanyl-D-alanine dipeptidase [Verrucomicrobiota bacterium]